jgi:uncharacterized protein Usg
MEIAMTALEKQLVESYRLTTAEILYQMPDHPHLLQTFVWQDYDRAPEYPELQRFLTFWVDHIDGSLHSVRVESLDVIRPPHMIYVAQSFAIH